MKYSLPYSYEKFAGGQGEHEPPETEDVFCEQAVQVGLPGPGANLPAEQFPQAVCCGFGILFVLHRKQAVQPKPPLN